MSTLCGKAKKQCFLAMSTEQKMFLSGRQAFLSFVDKKKLMFLILGIRPQDLIIRIAEIFGTRRKKKHISRKGLFHFFMERMVYKLEVCPALSPHFPIPLLARLSSLEHVPPVNPPVRASSWRKGCRGRKCECEHRLVIARLLLPLPPPLSPTGTWLYSLLFTTRQTEECGMLEWVGCTWPYWFWCPITKHSWIDRLWIWMGFGRGRKKVYRAVGCFWHRHRRQLLGHSMLQDVGGECDRRERDKRSATKLPKQNTKWM